MTENELRNLLDFRTRQRNDERARAERAEATVTRLTEALEAWIERNEQLGLAIPTKARAALAASSRPAAPPGETSVAEALQLAQTWREHEEAGFPRGATLHPVLPEHLIALSDALLVAQQELAGSQRSVSELVGTATNLRKRAERAEATVTRLREAQTVAWTMLGELLAASEDWPETDEVMIVRADLKASCALLAQDTEQETTVPDRSEIRRAIRMRDTDEGAY